jgi:hypothetical protein
VPREPEGDALKDKTGDDIAAISASGSRAKRGDRSARAGRRAGEVGPGTRAVATSGSFTPSHAAAGGAISLVALFGCARCEPITQQSRRERAAGPRVQANSIARAHSRRPWREDR